MQQYGDAEPEMPNLLDLTESASSSSSGDSAQWDDSSFDNSDGAWDPPVAPAPPPPPPAPRRPIECINIGRVSGPYKRRHGFHTEVAVQHPGALETKHRLWFGHEVLSDVAKLRERNGPDIEAGRFSEAVITFLKEKGVDLSDPDWGMADDSIPFSTEHLPMRTLFEYYGSEILEYLAESTLHDFVDEKEPVDPKNLGRYKELEEGEEFITLGAM